MPRDSSAFLRDWSTQLRNNIGDIQASLHAPSSLQKLREDIIKLLFSENSSTVTDDEILKRIRILVDALDDASEVEREKWLRWALDNVS